MNRGIAAALICAFALGAGGCERFGIGRRGSETVAPPAETVAPVEVPPDTPQEPESPPASAQGEPLAVVNGAVIDEQQFESGYAGWRRANNSAPDTPDRRRQFLNLMIDDLLMGQRVDAYSLTNDPVFQERLANARRAAMAESLLEWTLNQSLHVTDAEIEAEYERNRDEHVRPQSVTVRNITTYTRETAESARRRILGGEDFAAVAAAVSVHPSRSGGGLLPPFTRGTYNAEFEDKVFPLAIGEVSEIFQTELGFHVVQKTGETPGQVTPLEDVRESIRARLAESKRERAFEALTRSLREGADIQVLREP